MVKVIAGKQGAGKTKQLIDLVHQVVENEQGLVVCIENGQKLRFDINHGARLVDISAYPVKSFEALLGFLGGLCAANFDISQIFINSLYRVAGSSDGQAAAEFLEKLDAYSAVNKVDFTMTVSIEMEDAPEEMKKYFF
ncbi:MAG: hypothetical protein N2Z65_04890 [Clostridiales bacterium]|nr:hypothetical protein [Clostridiales bacterium]